MRTATALLIALALLSSGCIGKPSSGPPAAPAAGTTGHGKPATTAEEKVVEKHILDNANEPASVVFDAWGPHNIRPAEHERRPDSIDAVVRCRWRETNNVGAVELRDKLFVLMMGRVGGVSENGAGDRWKELLPNEPWIDPKEIDKKP